MVMANLDSEVKELSSSTVDTMKQCMSKVSIYIYIYILCNTYWLVFIPCKKVTDEGGAIIGLQAHLI